jgi:nucleoside-diphosphate-sugar epimerase
MQSLNIAITGASGFVGSCLVDMLLHSGHNISVLTRNKQEVFPSGVKVVYGDLVLGGEALRFFLTDCDVLYHCAAEIAEPNLMYATHVEGTKNLINAIANSKLASKKIIHWIQLSSVGVYGPQTEGVINEVSKLNPINEYERTKLKSDQLLADAASSNLVNATILRPTNIYGKKMTNNSLFSLIKAIDYGLFFYVNKNACTNYIHVKNVCHALCLLGRISNFHGSRIYILADCMPITSFVEVICIALGRNNKFIKIPRFLSYILYFTFCRLPKFPLSQTRFRALDSEAIYDATLIEKDIGYSRIISAKIGLTKIVKHYLKDKKQ